MALARLWLRYYYQELPEWLASTREDVQYTKARLAELRGQLHDLVPGGLAAILGVDVYGKGGHGDPTAVAAVALRKERQEITREIMRLTVSHGRLTASIAEHERFGAYVASAVRMVRPDLREVIEKHYTPTREYARGVPIYRLAAQLDRDESSIRENLVDAYEQIERYVLRRVADNPVPTLAKYSPEFFPAESRQVPASRRQLVLS